MRHSQLPRIRDDDKLPFDGLIEPPTEERRDCLTEMTHERHIKMTSIWTLMYKLGAVCNSLGVEDGDSATLPPSIFWILTCMFALGPLEDNFPAQHLEWSLMIIKKQSA